jgi:hypothetical protein
MIKKWNLEKPQRQRRRKSEEDGITLTIRYKFYKRLSQIKTNEDLRTFDEVIAFLLDNYEKQKNL